ncbi:MAG: hypothetical protein ACREJ2_03595 [Planctomycetota bacterium]
MNHRKHWTVFGGLCLAAVTALSLAGCGSTTSATPTGEPTHGTTPATTNTAPSDSPTGANTMKSPSSATAGSSAGSATKAPANAGGTDPVTAAAAQTPADPPADPPDAAAGTTPTAKNGEPIVSGRANPEQAPVRGETALPAPGQVRTEVYICVKDAVVSTQPGICPVCHEKLEETPLANPDPTVGEVTGQKIVHPVYGVVLGKPYAFTSAESLVTMLKNPEMYIKEAQERASAAKEHPATGSSRSNMTPPAGSNAPTAAATSDAETPHR